MDPPDHNEKDLSDDDPESVPVRGVVVHEAADLKESNACRRRHRQVGCHPLWQDINCFTGWVMILSQMGIWSCFNRVNR